MSKLGELHMEEDRAQLELEKAEKEAQRIRMSIPDLQDEQSKEKDDQLKATVQKERAEVERKTDELAKSLTAETEKKLQKLAESSDILEKAATEQLKEYILISGRKT
ncbi:MAG: hypothetical protein K8S15_09735 [Candidatus Aegiribacteria sp.]|nr:hypothetical protein [Candidatus Aegiribacteria sp.]